MTKINQKGAGHLILILAVALIAAVGIVGYRVAGTQNTEESSSTISEASNHSVSVPDQFNTAADISQASKALDNTSVDSEIDPSQLDQELDSLL